MADAVNTMSAMAEAAELTEADLLAAVRAMGDQQDAAEAEAETDTGDEVESKATGKTSTRAASAATPTAAETAAELEAAVARVLDARLGAAISPLRQELQQLAARAQAAEARGQTVPVWVEQSIGALNTRVEKMLTDAMTPEEHIAYLQQKKIDEDRARAEAWQRQQQAAQQQAQLEQQRQQGELSTNQYEEQVKAFHGNHFNENVVPMMLDLAAGLGVDEAQAQADIDKGRVHPMRDAQGNLTGFDWTRYRKELTEQWKTQADRRDAVRATARGNGDASKPGSAIPKGFDPFDNKRTQSSILNDPAFLRSL